MIILALDGLEKKLVEQFHCRHLQQSLYGNTSLDGFQLPKTVVLWSSFLTGRNMEPFVDPNLWEFKVPIEQTFLKYFKRPLALDLPGFSYGKEHVKERKLLQEFFQTKDEEGILEKYRQVAWTIHRQNKQKFLRAFGQGHDLLIGYFAIADVIGHLCFGNESEMKKIYLELDEISQVATQKTWGRPMLIISDHGMKAVGKFGDHTKRGFYSLNFSAQLSKTPKITDFFALIQNHARGNVFIASKKKKSP